MHGTKTWRDYYCLVFKAFLPKRTQIAVVYLGTRRYSTTLELKPLDRLNYYMQYCVFFSALHVFLVFF